MYDVIYINDRSQLFKLTTLFCLTPFRCFAPAFKSPENVFLVALDFLATGGALLVEAWAPFIIGALRGVTFDSRDGTGRLFSRIAAWNALFSA